MAASREEIDLVVNALTKGFDALDSDLKQTGDSFGKMALKQQLAAEKSKLFDAQMKELSAAVQKGTISMDEAGNRAEELARSLKLVDNASKDTTEAVQSQKLSWTDLKSAIDLGIQVYQKVAQVAKFAYDTIKEGAQLNLAADRFDNLTGTIDTTADALLGKMRDATQGMVSDAELIASANTLMTGKLARSEEAVVRLSSVSGQLNWDMGVLAQTINNQSTLRLDNLGLAVEDVIPRFNELKQTMADKDAFALAVIEAGEKQLGIMGNAAETTAGQMQQLEADWTNLTNSLKQGAAEAVGPLVSDFVKMGDGGDIAAQALEKGLITQMQAFTVQSRLASGGGKDLAEEFAKMGLVIDETGKIIGTITEDGIKLNAMYEKQTAAVEEATDAYVQHDEKLRDVNRALLEFGGDLGPTTRELEEMAYASGDAASSKEQLADGIDRAKEALEAEAAAAEAAADAEEEAARAAKEHAASMGDLFRAAIESKDGIGLFNETAGEMVDRSIYVSNLTRDQRDALSDLQAEYEKAQGIINDYTIGAKGVGMETEAVNEKVAEQQERMAELQAAMEPLLAVGGEFAAVQGTTTLNQEALNQAIFDAADAQGASAEQLAILGGALGLYSEEALNAALQSALIQAKIQELTAQYLAGDISVQQMKDSIYAFAESLNTIPGSVTTDVQVTGVDEAIGKVGSLQAQLSALGGQVSAAEAAGAVQKPGGGVGLAGGADFVVPPGYPNDSFGPIYLQSGEHVQVTPPGQSGGGRSGMVQNNYFNNASNPEATATAVVNKIGNLR